MGFITLHNVSKIFTQGNTLDIVGLHHISLTIEKSDFIVISGPSGSGKTTLLNMIGGLDNVTSGDITLDGMKLTGLSEKKLSLIRRNHIGFVFQAYNLIPVLTARENIEYIMKLQGIAQKDCDARTNEIAARLHIDELLYKLPNQLSGGQQQRVAVARAVAAKPKLILADEPTANLDSKSSENLIDMMQVLNREEEITILIASHDPMILSKAARSINMRDGRIITDKARPLATAETQ